MGIVKSIFSWKRRKAEEATIAANVPCESAATLLMMLMPDASGIATYQLHTFSAASQAEDYLQSILRGEIQEGTIMFWGLTWPPSDSSPAVEAEPVVLIRDPKRPGLVYTFSFVDLDSVYDFVRHEIRAGLDLAQAAIYWAAPAEATANAWGEITVSPSRSPSRQPDTNAVASSSAPAPHIDEPPSVGVPELVPEEPSATAEPEAAGEPETIDEPATAREPEAAGEPAQRAIEATDISNVVHILQARGLREPESPPQPIDEPETPESAGDETMHIDLGDVFGGRRDPETPTTLEDFRRSRETRETNDADAAPEDVTEAPAETVSGTIAAWSNIVAAIDEAIDADVARRVSAIVSWRRLTRAFVDAADVRMLVTWRRITQALHAGAATRIARERGLAKAWCRLTHAFAVAVNVRMLVAWRAITRALNAAAAIHTARESALADAWGNAARACHQAAESKSGRRAMRLAWARISWTLEEAVYAARLQRRGCR